MVEETNIGDYIDKCLLEYYHGLCDVTQFVASVHLAINNYLPSNVKDQSLLLTLAYDEDIRKDHRYIPEDIYKLSDGTEDYAIRLSIIAMCSLTEECLYKILSPIEALRMMFIQSTDAPKSYHDLLTEQLKRLSDKPFGTLLGIAEKVVNSVEPITDIEHWSVLWTGLKNIKKIRNCLAHRLGKITKLDIPQNCDKLVFTWFDLGLYYGVLPLQGTPTQIPGGVGISARVTEKTVSWKEGEFVTFQPVDVTPLAISLNAALSRLAIISIRAFIKLVQSHST